MPPLQAGVHPRSEKNDCVYVRVIQQKKRISPSYCYPATVPQITLTNGAINDMQVAVYSFRPTESRCSETT